MKTSWMKRQQYLGYLFIGPNMVGVMLFYCASLVFVLSHVYGLQIYELGHEVRGTGQYSKMLGDEVFYISIKNTLFFLLSVPVSIGLAFIVAVVLNRSVYLKSRSAPYISCLTSPVASPSPSYGSLLFHPNNGPINGILKSFGITNPRDGCPPWIPPCMPSTSSGSGLCSAIT